MENLDPTTTSTTTSKELRIGSDAARYLMETAKWGRFLAIMGFVFCGLMVVAGIAMTLFLGAFSTEDEKMPFNMAWMGLIYVGFALIFLFPSLYLFRFGTHISRSLHAMEQSTFDSGLQNLKSTFKFMGLYTIIALGIYVLILVGMAVGGLIGALL